MDKKEMTKNSVFFQIDQIQLVYFGHSIMIVRSAII